jgi:hypothetical protein
VGIGDGPAIERTEWRNFWSRSQAVTKSEVRIAEISALSQELRPSVINREVTVGYRSQRRADISATSRRPTKLSRYRECSKIR